MSLRRESSDFNTANFPVSKAAKATHTVILELRRLRQEVHLEFEGSLGCRVTLKCLNI